MGELIEDSPDPKVIGPQRGGLLMVRVKLRPAFMLLATSLVTLGLTAPVHAQSEILFNVAGVGTIYDPLPPSPEAPFLEFDAIGTATGLGVYQTSRSTLEVLFGEAVPGEDAIPFENADDPPIILFQSDKGTQAFHYDATAPGLGVTLFPVGDDKLSGLLPG